MYYYYYFNILCLLLNCYIKKYRTQILHNLLHKTDNTSTYNKNIEWDDTGYHNYYSVTPNENTNGKRVAKLYEILYFYFLTSMLIIPRVHSY